MKYLFIVLFILCAATLATFVVLFLPVQEKSRDSEAVVTINGRAISRQYIQDFQDNESHSDGRNDSLNEFVTRQLLIAAAQRREIDKEPGFRKALKQYYEHSLVKILMDRVSRELMVAVSDAEVEAYLASFGRTFIFYTLETSGEVAPEQIRSEGEKHVIVFDNLGTPLQMVLAGLKPGESGSTYITGNEKMSVHLVGIEGESAPRQNIDREDLRRQLNQAKLEKQINSWIEQLHRDASVTYHTTRE